MQRINQERGTEHCLCLFDLEDFYSGRKLIVNVSQSIISLLPGEDDQDEYIIAQCVLKESEMRVLLPLLYSPACCKQEVLQASYSCAYKFLLHFLLFRTDRSIVLWTNLVQEHRDRLQLAQQKKTQREEMRLVYNALSSLRRKLKPLGLAIRRRRDGYYLSKEGEN